MLYEDLCENGVQKKIYCIDLMDSSLPTLASILATVHDAPAAAPAPGPPAPPGLACSPERRMTRSDSCLDDLLTTLEQEEISTDRLRSGLSAASTRRRRDSIGGEEDRLALAIPTLEMRNSKPRKRGGKGRLYVAYVIEVRKGGVEWRLARRFSEFYALYMMLKRLNRSAVADLPRLPPKRVKVGMSKFDPKFTLMRREKLEAFLQGLVGAIDVEASDVIDDFLEYSEHMILASVSALRGMDGGNQIASLLQSSMREGDRARHFLSSSDSMGGGAGGDGGGRGGKDDDLASSVTTDGLSEQNSSDDEMAAGDLDLGLKRDGDGGGGGGDRGAGGGRPPGERSSDGEVVNALHEMLRSLHERLHAAHSLREDTEAKLHADEATLSHLKAELNQQRIKTQDIQMQVHQLDAQARDRKTGLVTKRGRMLAERKILVTEIKSLQAQDAKNEEDTVLFRQQYQEAYAQLVKAKAAPVSAVASERQSVSVALDSARMLRKALERISSGGDSSGGGGKDHSEEEVNRVSALVDEVGRDASHQEILVHLRELLHESTNLLRV